TFISYCQQAQISSAKLELYNHLTELHLKATGKLGNKTESCQKFLSAFDLASEPGQAGTKKKTHAV
ncbi:MAG: hypothetical protein ACE5HS_19130, partial [bacterium]